MIKTKIYIIFLMLSLACGSPSLSPADYVHWVENRDNGLIYSKKVGLFEYSILYKPVEYIAIKELGKEEINQKRIEGKLKELKDLQYFTLKIKADEGNDLLKAGITEEAEYYDRLNYISGFMADDIKLIEGKDTLVCRLYNMERNYGLAPYNNIVLAFDAKENNNQDKQIEINDKGFGVGKMILRIKKEDIENIPQLKL